MQDRIYLGHLNNYNLLGEFVLHFEKNIFIELKEKEPVFIEIDNRLVPFFIKEFKRKSKNSAIISFDDIITTERLEKVVGNKVFAIDKDQEVEIEEKDFDVTDLVGFTLFDTQKGEIGIVKEVNIYSYNIILAVFKGRKEILVPYAKEIILDIDFDKKSIQAELPEGLLDLYI